VEFQSFDAGYLERLAARDPVGERHFHDYFSELIRIKLRSRQFAPHAIDDIRQETFLRVLQAVRREGIRDPQRIGAFVNSTCNFVAMEYGRSGARYKVPDTDVPEVRDEHPDSERAMLAVEEQKQVRTILEKIPDKDRRLLSAVFLEERSSEEICRQFGIEANYLRVLLFRARTRFRQAMEKQKALIAKKSM
jgi:RNA polymerase sigma-70 factor, ECF subfamily